MPVATTVNAELPATAEAGEMEASAGAVLVLPPLLPAGARVPPFCSV